MTAIEQEHLIQSVADALQYISYYHPADYIAALGDAYAAETSPAAKDAIAQILTNSRMCAEGHRPICQDTGIVVAFVRVGMDMRFPDATMSVTDMVNEGVRRAYLHPDNTLRASILRDPAGKRTNTRDNTPAVVHFDLVPGDTIDVRIAAKGGGSENKAKFTMLNPSDSIVDWVLKTVPTMGAGWCPPGMLGIGIGGSAEKAMVLAKESLMEPIDMHALKARGPANRLEELRIEIYDKVNALGIGAQGLGGLSTVLDVKILDYPTHAASLPVAIIPNCAATRHAHFTLDGSGIATLDPPDLADWPDVHWVPAPESKRVDRPENGQGGFLDRPTGDVLRKPDFEGHDRGFFRSGRVERSLRLRQSPPLTVERRRLASPGDLGEVANGLIAEEVARRHFEADLTHLREKSNGFE